jgi:hypothetical protein
MTRTVLAGLLLFFATGCFDYGFHHPSHLLFAALAALANVFAAWVLLHFEYDV